MIKKILIIVIFIFLFSTGALTGETEGLLRQPATWNGRLLFTDNRASSLYTLKDGEVVLLAEGRGIGYHVSQSSASAILGAKIILDNGLQVPVLIHPGEKKPVYLQKPVSEAGQVSFTAEGIAAWTSGTHLHLSDGRSCKLPAYANLAPVSPDGRYVVSNDSEDKLWLTEISTNKRILISPAVNQGFYRPDWSPDGTAILFSSLSGTLYLYSIKEQKARELCDGLSPVWKDAETFLFHRVEVEEGVAVNADIYSYSLKTGQVQNLTRTKNQFEMDPYWDDENQRLLYQTHKEMEIAALSMKKGESKTLFKAKEPLPVQYYDKVSTSKSPVYFEIPYVNQVYDPSDWFGAGSAACGGTSAVMCLAYYGTIDPWPTSASRPYPHESLYGRYICDKYYTILGYHMDRIGYSRGNHGWGAFGYITQNNWTDTKGYMAEYAWKNGMANKPVDWSPNRSELIDQVQKRQPFVLLNSLTSAGHYISVIGHENSSATTIIVNDPYGNKNTPGYPSFDGELTRYDWPGYNNGYQNLNTVWCYIYFQAEIRPRPDIALDMQTDIPDTIYAGRMIDIQTFIHNEGDTLSSPTQIRLTLKDVGVNKLGYDSLLIIRNIPSLETGSFFDLDTAIQIPDSLINDTYLLTIDVLADTHHQEIRYSNNVFSKEVKVVGYPYFYSFSPPDGEVVNSTNPVLFAKFRGLIVKVNTDSVFLSLNGVNINEDCSWNTREIRRISEEPLDPGDYTAEVRARNYAGYESQYRWQFTLTSTALDPKESVPDRYELSVAPNPFNPQGTFSLSLPERGYTRLDIFDIRGRLVNTLLDGYHSAGQYTLQWPGTDASGRFAGSGVYIARLLSQAGIKTTRFVLLK
jgi:hypothetical protein